MTDLCHGEAGGKQEVLPSAQEKEPPKANQLLLNQMIQGTLNSTKANLLQSSIAENKQPDQSKSDTGLAPQMSLNQNLIEFKNAIVELA